MSQWKINAPIMALCIGVALGSVACVANGGDDEQETAVTASVDGRTADAQQAWSPFGGPFPWLFPWCRSCCGCGW